MRLRGWHPGRRALAGGGVACAPGAGGEGAPFSASQHLTASPALSRLRALGACW